MIGIADPTDVVTVAQGEKGKDSYGAVLYCVDSPHEMEPFFLHHEPYCGLDFNPESRCLKGLSRKIQRFNGQKLLSWQGALLVARDLLRYLENPFLDEEPARRLAAPDPDDLRFLFRKGAREVFPIRA